MSLLQRAEKWTREWFAEGKAEGKAEGRRLGKAETLKDQAIQRFGDLPSWAVDRIDRADVETLDRWLGRILIARRLEDLFDHG